MLQKFALKIGSLNIAGGLKRKWTSPDIQNLITRHDIFCFIESWLSPDDSCPSIDDYMTFRSERKNKHKNARRHSGGLLIYCKKSIFGGITKLNNNHSDIQWLKLDKTFFGLTHDLYMCIIYIRPETSPGNSDVDVFDLLRQDVEKYSNIGQVAILGDLNSRVGLRQEEHYAIDPHSSADQARRVSVPHRVSSDVRVNSHGRKLLRLLSNYDLLIANGRTTGDLSGKYTCEEYNGNSVCDLCITHRDLLPRLMYFRVEEFNWFSDHAPISLSLKVNINRDFNMLRYWRQIIKNAQRWNDETKSKFQDVLSSNNIKGRLDLFCETTFTDSNVVATQFTSIMQEVIRQTFPKKVRKKKLFKRKEKYFSVECELAKRIFKKVQRDYRYDKNNLNRKQIYLREKKKYKKIIYKTTKLATENKINKLSDLESSDPQTFWRKIKNMTSPREDVVTNLDPNKWSEHFENLLHSPPAGNANQQFQEYVSNSLPTLERIAIPDDSLNCIIKKEEVHDIVKHLKLGKSVYLDEVSNEAIKCGYSYLDKCLLHLYNTVLKSRVFPDLWSESIITPLHKKGDKLDVNNYRGIMISSCVGKIFLKILTKRIDQLMKNNKKWCLNQCGFKEDHRTEDSLFILQTVFKSYVENRNEKLYIAFVDFSKFFDKINRKYLMYKLLKYGITGPVYDIIKSMYEKTVYRVKIGDRISPSFQGKNGVKQGCVISPLLSNIFQNDMHDIFGALECDPINIGSITLNSLSWADDLIVISRSQKGLQICLNNLKIYCDKWGLEVNTEKTKTMVFSKRGFHFVDLYFGGMLLECVKIYTYLGFKVSNNGRVTQMVDDRIGKSTRIANLVLQALRTTGNVNVKVSMSIFDKQIAPILLYGSAIWALPQSHNLLYIHDQPEGTNARTLVKHLLQDICGRDIPLQYTRRVGRVNPQRMRKILVKVKNYEDKELILRQRSPYISNFESEVKYKIDKVHTDFCKRSLNMTKYSSTTAVMGELGRYPIVYNAWSHSIKYWLRLNAGTKNTVLNEAYQVVLAEKHDWIQSIQYLLCKNGFRNVWLSPNEVNMEHFHKIFKRRLYDQYEQTFFSKLTNSDRLTVLSSMKTEFKRSGYIDKIRSPDIRKTFTRLRIDNNILNDCKFRFKQIISKSCYHCKNVTEGVNHFLLDCDLYKQKREAFYGIVSKIDSSFVQLSSRKKLNFILNLECPVDLQGACCKFVQDIYSIRQDM